MIEILLSGLIGAIIGAGIIIVFTILRDNKIEKKKLAKEKLEKVYSPLVALKKKIDLVNQSEGGFLLPSTAEEIKMVEKIIFHYYYLLEGNLKEKLPLLHSQLRNNITSQMKIVNIMNEINKYYKINKKILGIK